MTVLVDLFLVLREVSMLGATIRTFLRMASGLGIGLGIILFLVGLGSLIAKGE